MIFFLISAEELSQTPEASPELTKRSWFGSLMSTDRDETYTIIVKEKPLASIKADLVQAFLSVSFSLYTPLYIYKRAPQHGVDRATPSYMEATVHFFLLKVVIN